MASLYKHGKHSLIQRCEGVLDISHLAVMTLPEYYMCALILVMFVIKLICDNSF